METGGSAGAASPWRRALREERARPSGVTGPWDLVPLARDAAVCFSLGAGVSESISDGMWPPLGRLTGAAFRARLR